MGGALPGNLDDLYNFVVMKHLLTNAIMASDLCTERGDVVCQQTDQEGIRTPLPRGSLKRVTSLMFRETL